MEELGAPRIAVFEAAQGLRLDAILLVSTTLNEPENSASNQ
jgi:hypothetical protein